MEGAERAEGGGPSRTSARVSRFDTELHTLVDDHERRREHRPPQKKRR